MTTTPPPDGIGLMAWGMEFRVPNSWFKVQGSGSRVWGLGSRIQGLGLGLGVRG